jgi:ribose 5-phosphate isomerase A
MMNALNLKKMVAKAALEYVQPETVLGVGTGSTVDCFIDALAESGIKLKGAVPSSVRSENKLREIGVTIIDMNEVQSLSLYVDGADEVSPEKCLIKGGGGANTREKIVADISEKFVCIADQSKQVSVLGQFPLPVEVLPIACQSIARKLSALGGNVKLREGFITDNGNMILDVSGLKITDPVTLEKEINQWPGVVTNGIFAIRKADVVLIATPEGIKTL